TIGFGIRPSKPRESVVTNGKFVGRAIDDLGHPLFLIQARLREGNSGGPIVDADGTLMGMVTGRDTTRPELGIAIPAGASDTFLKPQGRARMRSARSGDLAAPAANRLKAVSVLVQCSPSASRGWWGRLPVCFILPADLAIPPSRAASGCGAKRTSPRHPFAI